MSGKINLKELREFAGMTRDHPNELVYSDAALALVEAVECAHRLICAMHHDGTFETDALEEELSYFAFSESSEGGAS